MQFIAKLFKKAHKVETLPFLVTFDKGVVDKIEGRGTEKDPNYRHIHGDLPIQVVKDSLGQGSGLGPAPVPLYVTVHEERQDRVEFISIGRAIPGMKDGQGKVLEPGKAIFILTSVGIQSHQFVAITAYPMLKSEAVRRIKKYSENATTGLSLKAWNQKLKTFGNYQPPKATIPTPPKFSQQDIADMVGATADEIQELLREDPANLDLVHELMNDEDKATVSKEMIIQVFG